ncbi:hypothetical protein ABW21_db0207294 [Orbilia brochopaga]|nr:hypothetical protein ABW21_db0207294 [Drechslerella brochopaga]
MPTAAMIAPRTTIIMTAEIRMGLNLSEESSLLCGAAVLEAELVPVDFGVPEAAETRDNVDDMADGFVTTVSVRSPVKVMALPFAAELTGRRVCEAGMSTTVIWVFTIGEPDSVTVVNCWTTMNPGFVYVVVASMTIEGGRMRLEGRPFPGIGEADATASCRGCRNACVVEEAVETVEDG